VETREWREAWGSVLACEGPERARFLLGELVREAQAKGAPVPHSAHTPYLNTVPVERQAKHPGDRAVEHKIRSTIRWNALAIVLRANKESSGLGRHIASFQSAATLYHTGGGGPVGPRSLEADGRSTHMFLHWYHSTNAGVRLPPLQW
jgi:pyruvate dehydrogenase E1 component